MLKHTLVLWACFLLATSAAAQQGSPRVVSWRWDDPRLEDAIFEWSTHPVTTWQEVTWAQNATGQFFGFLFTDGYVGPIALRVMVWDGSQWLVSLPSNPAEYPTCAALDFDGDGVVGITEFGFMKQHFGQTCQTE
jgi:hypothetical protein